MRNLPALLCIVLLALGSSSTARFVIRDRRLSEEDDFYGMPPAPQQALLPTESPSASLSGLHLTGSLPQDGTSSQVREWDPMIRSFLVKSKQPGTGCHHLSAKQPLQQRMAEASPAPTNYFFRGSSGIGGVSSNQGDGAQSETITGSQDPGDSQDGQADGAASTPPCADLPFNIFAALSRDGYVRHTALSGDQPEFK